MEPTPPDRSDRREQSQKEWLREFGATHATNEVSTEPNVVAWGELRLKGDKANTLLIVRIFDNNSSLDFDQQILMPDKLIEFTIYTKSDKPDESLLVSDGDDDFIIAEIGNKEINFSDPSFTAQDGEDHIANFRQHYHLDWYNKPV